MNLRNGTKVWRDTDAREVLEDLLRLPSTQALDYTSAHKLRVLTGIVARLVIEAAKDDEHTLELLGAYDWEVDTRTDEEVHQETIAPPALPSKAGYLPGTLIWFDPNNPGLF